MIQQTYDTIVSKIVSTANISKEEVEAQISKKLDELSGLISKEGAAHIIANELNVKLFDNSPKELKIKDILPAQQSISITAKILTISEPRSYESKGRKGRVASMFVGDETGSMRITIWDEKLIDFMKTLNEGDIVKVNNAYSRLNNNFKELHLGSKSQLIVNPPGVTIEVNTQRSAAPAVKKAIKDLVEGEFATLSAHIVQLFEPKYYQACPTCNKKVNMVEDAYQCGEHGTVAPKQVPILNLVLDDGTGNIRGVAFRDIAESIIGKEFTNFEEVKKNVLGTQYSVKGKVNKNQMFDRLEFAINNVEKVDPDKLLADLEMS
jgi:ssDNA-binding replication factor A large subunit